jgi:subtilisin family serine protease
MRQPPRRDGRCRPPRLECLEDRTLPATGPVGPILDLSDLQVDSSTYDHSHVLVQFRAGSAPVALTGSTVGQVVDPSVGLYQVNVLAGTTVEQAVARYRADPSVVTADFDYTVSSSWLPNDPKLSAQWDMHNTGQLGGTPGADVNAGAAWGITTGSMRTIVAVVDTGIDYTHPDLYENIWINQAEIPPSRRANLVDVDHDGLITFRDLNNPINQGPGKITDLNHNGYIDAGDILAPMIKNAQGGDSGLGGWADGIDHDHDGYVNDLVGWDFGDNNNKPLDANGHGTHVAGTIGAMGNNGVGVAGMNWNVQMMDLRIFNSQGTASISSAIAALDYSVAHGARISNDSWVGAGNSTLLQAAIARAQAKGAIFVAAAGNNAVNTDVSPEYPADFPLDNVVSVAATDQYGHLASFSNYGATSVDLAAPGVSILSTLPGGNYGYYTGTSMATPHVTGVIALVWGLRPEWNYHQVITWVLSTVHKLPGLQGKMVSGGMLDAGAAVKVPPRTTTTASVSVASVPTISPTGTGSTTLKSAAVGEGAVNEVQAEPPITTPVTTSKQPSDAGRTPPPAIVRDEVSDLVFLSRFVLGRRREEWPQALLSSGEDD